MIISHKKRIIFIHIFKTGGTSVAKLIQPYARLKVRYAATFFGKYVVGFINRAFYSQSQGSAWLYGVRKHAYWDEVEEAFGHNTFSSYRKFAVVRNPYTWCISIYDFIRQNKINELHYLAKEKNIHDFLEFFFSYKDISQSRFIYDDGDTLKVDEVFKLEEISVNQSKLLNFLGIRNKNLSHLNQSKGKKVIKDRLDNESIRLINTKLSRDFTNFDYKKIQV